MHINLSFPRDAAVTLLSQFPSFRASLSSPCSVALCPAPSRHGGCVCHKTPCDLWGCCRKTLEGVAQQAWALCPLTLGATAGPGSHLLGAESPFRGATQSCFFPSWLFCILLAGHIVLSAGSYQGKSPAPTAWFDGMLRHPGFPEGSVRRGHPTVPIPHHAEATALPALTAAFGSSVVGQKVEMQTCHLLREMRCAKQRSLPSTQGSLFVFLLPSSLLLPSDIPSLWMDTRMPHLHRASSLMPKAACI